jgi:hypothetical protein
MTNPEAEKWQEWSDDVLAVKKEKKGKGTAKELLDYSDNILGEPQTWKRPTEKKKSKSKSKSKEKEAYA